LILSCSGYSVMSKLIRLLLPFYGATSRTWKHGKIYNHRILLKVGRYTAVATTAAAGLAVLSACVFHNKNHILNTIPVRKMHAFQLPFKPNDYNFIADVVEKVAPAVVSIELKGKLPFLGQTTLSNGSGVIVRSDGWILTNAHVVNNGRRDVYVKLYDGRVFEGIVKYIDQSSDLAAVKINATNLPDLKLNKGREVRPGEWVIALGSPYFLTNTVTVGVVSNARRLLSEHGQEKPIEYIQTDAMITMGNSGGPLVNLDGEIIGISTMQVTPGISFALPADHVSNFFQKCCQAELQSKKNESYFPKSLDMKRKCFLGITMLSLDNSLLSELRQRDPNFFNVTHGVLVHSVVLGSAAHERRRLVDVDHFKTFYIQCRVLLKGIQIFDQYNEVIYWTLCSIYFICIHNLGQKLVTSVVIKFILAKESELFAVMAGHDISQRDVTVHIFINGKCERSFRMKRNPRKTLWTVFYRRKHKKGVHAEEVVKRRVKRTTKFQRDIGKLTVEDILKRRNQRPEFRQAQREQAVKAAKEKTREAKAARKAEKMRAAQKAAAGRLKIAKPVKQQAPRVGGKR
ncbi:Serine protease HTRA2, mitochondrial, partial [Trichinella pseudospiralis]